MKGLYYDFVSIFVSKKKETKRRKTKRKERKGKKYTNHGLEIKIDAFGAEQ